MEAATATAKNGGEPIAGGAQCNFMRDHPLMEDLGRGGASRTNQITPPCHAWLGG